MLGGSNRSGHGLPWSGRGRPGRPVCGAHPGRAKLRALRARRARAGPSLAWPLLPRPPGTPPSRRMVHGAWCGSRLLAPRMWGPGAGQVQASAGRARRARTPHGGGPASGTGQSSKPPGGRQAHAHTAVLMRACPPPGPLRGACVRTRARARAAVRSWRPCPCPDTPPAPLLQGARAQRTRRRDAHGRMQAALLLLLLPRVPPPLTGTLQVR